MNDYKIQVIKLKKDKSNIFDNEFKLIKSKNQIEPLLELGFHYYLHQAKDKMEILDSEKFKNKDFYLIVNKFEHIIKDNNVDIKTNTENFFNIKNKNKLILSRAYYKLWEILIFFDILPKDKSVITAHLAEGPGSFVQAIIMYRDKYNNEKSTNDKYCAITLDDKNNTPNLNKKRLECYSKKENQRYFQHKTTKKDNGDLTKLDTINNFVKDIENYKDKATLVTADGGFIWTNENYQEQESYKLLLGEILTCLKIQKNGGSFVLKIFDIFTKVTIKLISIIQHFYKDVYIFKPFMSRPSNSEKYIIAKDFSPGKNFSNEIKKLEDLLLDFNTIGSDYVFDIISDYSINDELNNQIRKFNCLLASIQFTEINKIISYINKKDYFGEDYHNYKKEQIKANNYWIKLFYQDMETITKIRNKILN